MHGINMLSGGGWRGRPLQRLHENLPRVLLDPRPIMATPRHLKFMVYLLPAQVEESPFASDQVKISHDCPAHHGYNLCDVHRGLRSWDILRYHLELD